MRASGIDGFTADKNWQRHTSKFRQIFTLITGYEIMFEESRRDIKPVIPIPKVDRPV